MVTAVKMHFVCGYSMYVARSEVMSSTSDDFLSRFPALPLLHEAPLHWLRSWA